MGRTSAPSSVTVTPATLVSITFIPANPTVASGTTTQVTVIGHYSDGSSQDLTSTSTFTSSNPLVAAASASGMITGLLPGTSTITVQAGGQTSSFNVIVSSATLTSITISPASPGSLPDGTTLQFTATGHFSDGTTQNLSTSATWLSSDNTVATVSQTGLATAVGLGSVTISVTAMGQTATTSSFAATPATIASITVSPQNPSLVVGGTQQFTASANYTDSTSQDVTSTVLWSSSSPAVATINPSGLAIAVTAGSSTITAQLASFSGTSSLNVTTAPAPTLQSITVTPASGANVATGSNLQFTATGTYSDNSTRNLTTQVTWTSTNVAIATIDSAGLATGVAPGSVTVQATLGTVSGSAPLAVSSSTAVLQTIVVSPPFVSVLPAGTQQFTATGHYSDNSTQDLTAQVTWSSSNTLTASISASGQATGLIPGNVIISALYNTTTGTASFTVSVPPTTLQSITVSPTTASIITGATQQFIATGHYSDSSTQNLTSSVTWTSSSAAASINSSGLATGLSAGTSTIGAAYMGDTATATLTVTLPPVTLQSIAVTPASAMINKAATQQFTATGTYSDSSTQNITSQVAWSSSVNGIASIDTTGLATAHLPGMTQIQATLSGQTGSATLTVNPATLTSIAVTPATATVANGTSQQYKAVGSFNDGSTQDMTSNVTWSSSNTAEATINSAGLASTLSTGTVTISAQSGGQTGTATLTISSATPTSLQITPSSISNLPAGDVQQLTTTATFTDGSSQNVTSSAAYSTSDRPLCRHRQSKRSSLSRRPRLGHYHRNSRRRHGHPARHHQQRSPYLHRRHPRQPKHPRRPGSAAHRHRHLLRRQHRGPHQHRHLDQLRSLRHPRQLHRQRYRHEPRHRHHHRHPLRRLRHRHRHRHLRRRHRYLRQPCLRYPRRRPDPAVRRHRHLLRQLPAERHRLRPLERLRRLQGLDRQRFQRRPPHRQRCRLTLRPGHHRRSQRLRLGYHHCGDALLAHHQSQRRPLTSCRHHQAALRHCRLLRRLKRRRHQPRHLDQRTGLHRLR